MPVDAAILNLKNPAFRTYVSAAGIMILKLMLQPWMTVVQMMKVGGGFPSPEDAKKNPINPKPDPAQLEVNEYVDRSHRIKLNDLESIPGFLAAGVLLVLTDPPLLLAHIAQNHLSPACSNRSSRSNAALRSSRYRQKRARY